MGHTLRYALRKPGLFLVGVASVLLSGFLMNVLSVGYLEMVKLREHWRDRFVVRAFFQENVTESEAQEVERQIAALSWVAQVVFVSPEEAKERFLARTGLSPESVADVPFPASLEVTPKRIEDLVAIVRNLEGHPAFSAVLYGGEDVERFLRLFRFLLRFGGGVFLGVLGFGVFVIVVVTVLGVQLRRKEVEVLTLVGAPGGFSLAPLLLEGVLFGLSGGIGAYLLSFFFLLPLLRLAGEVFPGFLWVEPEAFLVPLVLLDLCGGCGIGVLGVLFGYWGVRRKTR